MGCVTVISISVPSGPGTPASGIPRPVLMLAFQRLRICLPIQGTWVQSLVREIRAHTLQGNQTLVPQPLSPWAASTDALTSRACVPQQEKPPQWEATAAKSSPCLPQLEKVYGQQQRPRAVKNKIINSNFLDIEGRMRITKPQEVGDGQGSLVCCSP